MVAGTFQAREGLVQWRDPQSYGRRLFRHIRVQDGRDQLIPLPNNIKSLYFWIVNIWL